jgi:LPXTG-site transpeptidase (sortase) family protein
MILAMLAAFIPGSTSQAAGGVMIDETFRKDTATGWIFKDNAKLTSSDEDPTDQGWLRLTSSANDQKGSAIYNTAFDSSEGFNISFSYATWGGSTVGADGFSVFLIDGSVTDPTTGFWGGALGYAAALGNPGVTKGYIGIGFDEFGVFANNSVFNGGFGSSFYPGITVRGPGNLTDPGGFPFLTHYSSTNIPTTDRDNYIRVTIIMTAAPVNIGDPNQKLTVYFGGDKVIDAYEISNTTYPMPSTFKIGFSGATGSGTNNHEIRDLNVSGLNPTALTPSSSSPIGAVGENITFTATVTCQDKDTSSSIQPSGNITFLSDNETLGKVAVTGNPTATASFSTSDLVLGDHLITAIYTGDIECSTNFSSFTQSILTPAAAAKANELPKTGFRQGVVTTLPKQPASSAYKAYDSLVLEIPSLKVKANIVGVPQTSNGWDTSWLGANAGYLYGSAFPTWAGNSVISGHVWDADNKPGLFANLKSLKYGDKFMIHSYGNVYTYEVRESRVLWPSQTNIAMKSYEDHSWVTLLTCETFNFLGGDYNLRRMVRAVVVSIVAE